MKFFPSCPLLVRSWFAILLITGWASLGNADLRGAFSIHDPSTVVTSEGRYYIFGTGEGIISKSSADRELWAEGASVFSTPPAWTPVAVPSFDGIF